MFKKNIIPILCLLVMLAACTAAPTATPTVVPAVLPTPTPLPGTDTPEIYHLKIALYPYITEAPYFFAKDDGFFAEQGLDVEFVPFTNSSDVIPALVSGQIDLTTVFPGAAFFSAIARDATIKIVAGKGYYDAAGCTYSGFVASNSLFASGKLDDPKNWKGLKIATDMGSMSEYALDLLLHKNGLTLADVTLVNLPITNRSDALKTGAIDIAGAGEPWILRIKSAGTGDVWQPLNTLIPDATTGFVAFGPSLLEQHPDVGKRFMIALLKGIAKYNEGKTDSNVAIMAKYTKLKPEEIIGMCWNTMKSDGTINAQSLLDYQQWAVDQGYLTQIVTTEEFWDPQFIEYATQFLP